MKLIATANFRQGPNNPLRLPRDSRHVERGTEFSIGGDLPFEKLSKEQQVLHGQFSHCVCPLDSDQGRQILAECERVKKSAEDMKRAESARNRPHKYWYEKPAGLIAIGVVVGVVVYVLCKYLAHHFPNIFH